MARTAQALTGAQRRHLRSLAHSLDPIIQVGKASLTDGAIAQIDEALLVHELIKIRLLKEAPLDLEQLAKGIEKKAFGSIAQTIGRIVVAYRRHPDKPKIVLPRPGKAAAPARAPVKKDEEE